MKNAQYWVENIGMLEHPEGGYFKETYRAEGAFTPEGFSGERNFATSIYFLLEKDNISHFHRIKSDEIWYYHAGSPLTVHVIFPNGELKELKIGPNIENGEVLQAIVPANTIFGSTCTNDYSLVGCMVSPGFDFNDFELFPTSQLLAMYPQHKEIIKTLSKETYK
jgi:predicted cupin superfamily sugar epimerase